MASWSKAAQLVARCDTRKQRVLTTMARLDREQRQSLAQEQILAEHSADLDALLAEHLARGGVTDKAGLYEARRRLAVVLSQKNDVRLEQRQAKQQTQELEHQQHDERQRLLTLEKKRNTYQTWIELQQRQARKRRDLLEQSEIEERTQWCKL